MTKNVEFFARRESEARNDAARCLARLSTHWAEGPLGRGTGSIHLIRSDMAELELLLQALDRAVAALAAVEIVERT